MSGKLIEIKKLALDRNDISDFPAKSYFNLQPPDTWGIGKNGEIYISVQGPDYLYIYKALF